MGSERVDTVTLCPACFNAVTVVSPAIPAPTMRMLSCFELVFEPIVSRSRKCLPDMMLMSSIRPEILGPFKMSFM